MLCKLAGAALLSWTVAAGVSSAGEVGQPVTPPTVPLLQGDTPFPPTVVQPLPAVLPAPEPPRTPNMLNRPTESPPPGPPPAVAEDPLFVAPMDAPTGFSGPSSVTPTAFQENSHFVPIEDRWRIGFSPWDRYDKKHPIEDDYPYVEGHWWDPFNLNVLKGDYPIIGQHTFLNITGTSESVLDFRQVPTPQNVFDSTERPNSPEFFGRNGQFMYEQYFSLSFDLFHGDAAFKPVDWRVKITPIFNINTLNVNELAIVNPDVTKGTGRGRSFFALQEWFLETKLADLSPDYDFVSLRAGSQFFNSDFRGFLFSDTNRAVRLFGNLESNRDQFNLIWFNQMEKDTNSGLNNIGQNRNQDIVIANFYRQDFIWPGYTAQWSVNYNNDQPSFKFNKNNVLVRPDPDGVFQPHEVQVVYLGWAGDGHINRFNITHQVYWALGHDSLNPLANQPQDINAQFAAAELSYDRDWARFRISYLFASGDGNINNHHATGFDTIFDDPNFAGGEFSFWQRQAIQLFGVNLVNARSLVPDLRSSKIQGQSNFVNPGLHLINFGIDVDLTPKIKMINNINLLWFDKTNVLEQYVFQERIDRYIGTDLSMGIEYRPLLNNNIITTFGVSTLLPGQGFDDLFGKFKDNHLDPMVAAFLQLNLTF
jgi:hypothetical protein